MLIAERPNQGAEIWLIVLPAPDFVPRVGLADGRRFVFEAADELVGRFDSWEAVGENYLAGRLLWLQDHGQHDDPSQARFAEAANRLVSDSDSPWNRVAWDRSEGVIVDGTLWEPRRRR